MSRSKSHIESLLRDGPVLMGVVNVTPDSFSDGGKYLSADRAVEHALRLVSEGAKILDIGGESTRPGAEGVSAAQEQDRILPVIEKLRASGCGAMISVDTRNASTMRAVLHLGIEMINDVSALRHDKDSIEALKNSDCHVCLMHMLGEPGTMQENPVYTNVVEDVFEFLSSRLSTCMAAGIGKSRLIVDPGIGFGKTVVHNLELLSHLKRFEALGVPLLLGVSRKSFISKLTGAKRAGDRLPGSLAAMLYGLDQGARIFRVHDVAESAQAIRIWREIAALS